MPNLDKKVILTLAAFLILVIGLWSFFYVRQKDQAYKKALSENEALLVVDYGRGKERWFKGEVVQGMTVRDVLETSGSTGSFGFVANGALLELDGLSNGKEGKWRCYLNNRKLTGVLSQRIISPQDKIVCKYR
ncbi:MAG: hypothetical protein G01um101430_432 [Parcubacteria group bacterium Gr01-1014_30]|nr:MAG: hypothetical protein G01um101430_432 [Parcubacteria group bacterium Gr01-1014_30]